MPEPVADSPQTPNDENAIEIFKAALVRRGVSGEALNYAVDCYTVAFHAMTAAAIQLQNERAVGDARTTQLETALRQVVDVLAPLHSAALTDRDCRLCDAVDAARAALGGD